MYKIIAVTPAGRRRYMRLLVPYILSSDKIDRYDIWVNTEDTHDIAFLKALSAHPKVRLISQPNGIVDECRSINAFFNHAQEEDEVYIRFDDDIVWMEQDAIDNIIRFRLENTDDFIISPYVINNAMCTALLQLYGKLSEFPKVEPYCKDLTGWASPDFAERLHKTFLSALSKGDLDGFRGKDTRFAACRFSINCVSWFGKDLREFIKIIVESEEEEEELSFSIPTLARRPNAVVASALVAHFAYYTQRERLDNTKLLARYHEVRDRTSWLKPDVIVLVEEAYAEANRSGAVPERRPFIYRPFECPIAIKFRIKTRKTSVARIARGVLGL